MSNPPRRLPQEQTRPVGAVVIAEAFRRHGPLTIARCQQLTGLHSSRVRREVRPPRYQPVACEWAARRWQWTWRLVTTLCDCGQPAWYTGEFQTLSCDGKRALHRILLCAECAKLADERMIITRS